MEEYGAPQCAVINYGENKRRDGNSCYSNTSESDDEYCDAIGIQGNTIQNSLEEFSVEASFDDDVLYEEVMRHSLTF